MPLYVIVAFLTGIIAINIAYWMRYHMLPVFSAFLLATGVLITATCVPTLLSLAAEWGKTGTLIGALAFGAVLYPIIGYISECLPRRKA
jgi:hypothetical protein